MSGVVGNNVTDTIGEGTSEAIGVGVGEISSAGVSDGAALGDCVSSELGAGAGGGCWRGMLIAVDAATNANTIAARARRFTGLPAYTFRP